MLLNTVVLTDPQPELNEYQVEGERGGKEIGRERERVRKKRERMREKRERAEAKGTERKAEIETMQNETRRMLHEHC